MAFASIGQIGTGQWRLHVPSKKAIDVAAGNGSVFAAFENGLLEYTIEDEEKRLWTDVNGLSDIALTCLHFDANSNSLFIGYENGNFDKLKNGQVTNIPAIKLAQIQGSKRINKIVPHDGFMYLATGFAIVKIDPSKNEVKDTYYPTAGNDAILDLVIKGDSLYALSASRMYRGYLNNIALSDASQWVVDTRVPVELVNKYKELEKVNEEMYILYQKPVYGEDSVFRISNTGLELFTTNGFSLEIIGITAHGEDLAVNTEGATFIMNENSSYANIVNEYSFGGYPVVNNAIDYNGFVWIADNSKGLVRYYNQYSSLKIPFEGPPKKEFFSLDWQDNRLVVCGGGLSSISPTFSSSGIYIFEDEAWSLRDRDNMQMWNGQYIWDFTAAAINPKKKDQIAVGTFSSVPLSIMDATNQVVDTFTPNNSTLEYTAVGGYWSYVSGMAYDDEENLWLANAYSDRPLNVLSANGLWYSFDCGSSAKNKFSRKLVIDYNGHKWFALDGAGVIGYNDNGTIENAADDKYVNLNTGASTGDLPSSVVNALAVDFDNEIWIYQIV